MNAQNYSVAFSVAGFYVQHEIIDGDGNTVQRRESAFMPEEFALALCAQIQSGEVTSLQVLRSANGYYIGRTETSTGYPMPYSRDSVEYFMRKEDAQQALDSGTWTQRDHY
jgi:hypothetical protein